MLWHQDRLKGGPWVCYSPRALCVLNVGLVLNVPFPKSYTNNTRGSNKNSFKSADLFPQPVCS